MSELVCRTLELLAETKGSFVSAVKNIFNTRTMATLKISDISVGDWVRYDGRICQIAEIHQLSYNFGVKEIISFPHVTLYYEDDMPTYQESVILKDIHPIPITGEILEKNGFEDKGSSLFSYEREWRGDKSAVNIWSFDDEIWFADFEFRDSRTCLSIIPLIYINQLQHVLRLAGVDKEINLL